MIRFCVQQLRGHNFATFDPPPPSAWTVLALKVDKNRQFLDIWSFQQLLYDPVDLFLRKKCKRERKQQKFTSKKLTYLHKSKHIRILFEIAFGPIMNSPSKQWCQLLLDFRKLSLSSTRHVSRIDGSEIHLSISSLYNFQVTPNR